ncbi:tetratricopeptide repeat protein [Polyangium sp. 15x6]|uniref:tetratricopeptide repeat protein n=1 Tax=Polyangium sp. 15x6 TaxID=3042687 RepID=UPI00249C3E32|nr:tetratricopeptide repeat protein [Polyangium sp. 15x6]MDI3288876.1 tetratricopeptide repeat protein [Polyangium sp. 15x6]
MPDERSAGVAPAASRSAKLRPASASLEAPATGNVTAIDRTMGVTPDRLAAQSNDEVGAEALLGTAGRLFGKLQVREAIEIYQSIVNVEATRAEANNGLGWCYLHLREFNESIRYFETALDARPEFGRALYGAGLALLELGRLVAAASYARRLAGVPGDEHRARGLYVLGLVDRARGAWDEAVANLEESLRTYPHRRRGQPGWSEIRHRYELALCYRELNRPEQALEHLRWAAQHERKPGRIALDLAKLYLELERYEEAEKRFQAVLKQDPGNRAARVGLGRVYIARQDYTAAIESFREVLSSASDDLDALNGMAESYKGLGDLDRAARYLDQIRRLYRTPQVLLEQRLRSLENERQIRDAELLRIRNIAALNIMATGIAHELRQPLSVIRLAAQNARRDLARGNTSYIDADLADIDKGVVRLDKIIAVLRDAGSDELATDEVFLLDEAIDAAMSLFRAQLAHRDIEVLIENTADVLIIGSRVALQQVLVNLISNARDAMTDARVKKLTIAASEERGQVRITISDTGCGMSEAVRERALDPFFTTKQNGGTGLGLYICYNLLRRMNGSFRIRDTSIGRGTTFEILLRSAKGAVHG